MSLETMLRNAAPEAHFDPADVRSRVDRTRRRRRALGGLGAVALLAAGVVGWRALAGGDDESRVIAGQPDDGEPLTLSADDLAGGRWLADEALGSETSWLSFDVDGGWSAATECQVISGLWEIRSGRLELEETGTSLDVGCTTRFALGGAGQVVEGDTLRFTGREGAVVDFHRADRIATRATEDDLMTTWRAPGGDQTWVFQPGELRVNGCRLGAWRVEDADLQVQVPAPRCDGLRSDRQAFADAQFALGDGTAEPYLVDDQLYLVTSTTTIRLVRPEVTVPEDLTRSAWVASEVVEGQTIVPRLELQGDGSGQTGPSSRSTFVLYGACSIRQGTWALRGDQVSFTDVVQPTTDCRPRPGTRAADELVDRAIEDLSPDLVDGTLVFGGDVGVTFRLLDDLPPPTEGDLVGPWTTPDGAASVTFQASGGLDTAGGCRLGTWQLHLTTLRVLDRGRSCTVPPTDPVSRLLQVGAFVDVRLVGDQLFLTDELNPDTTGVFSAALVSRTNEAEP